MLRTARQLGDTLRLAARGGPAICNIAVTNRCNARCDFCNYAYDKEIVQQWTMVDFARLCEGLDILHTRGVRYLTFSGGEPLLHPQLADMVAYAVARGMRPAVCTNGARLTKSYIERLRSAGLKTVIVSIDAASAEVHERNRGLPGVCERVTKANRLLKEAGIKTVASVTISKLVDDYQRLLEFLRKLGFETATFSYPKRAVSSSSLVFSETSALIDFTPAELIRAFETILGLKSRFDILNPAASLAEMIRFLKGEQQVFPCFGGFKYFFMDWNLDVYRCDFLPTKLGSVQEFRDRPFIRDNCTQCMSDCYRDASVLLHFPVALSDALVHLRHGELAQAVRTLFTHSTLQSVKSLVEQSSTLARLAQLRAKGA